MRYFLILLVLVGLTVNRAAHAHDHRTAYTFLVAISGYNTNEIANAVNCFGKT